MMPTPHPQRPRCPRSNLRQVIAPRPLRVGGCRERCPDITRKRTGRSTSPILRSASRHRRAARQETAESRASTTTGERSMTPVEVGGEGVGRRIGETPPVIYPPIVSIMGHNIDSETKRYISDGPFMFAPAYPGVWQRPRSCSMSRFVSWAGGGYTLTAWHAAAGRSTCPCG